MMCNAYKTLSELFDCFVLRFLDMFTRAFGSLNYGRCHIILAIVKAIALL